MIKGSEKDGFERQETPTEVATVSSIASGVGTIRNPGQGEALQLRE